MRLGDDINDRADGKKPCVLMALHISAFGEMVPGISSDLMTWVDLHYAALEAFGFDESYKVYICTKGGGNRRDIQEGRTTWHCS